MLHGPAPRPGFGWKVLQSWWVLFSLLGFGCFSGVGFVLIGLRARKPWWTGTGIAYLLIGSGLFVLASRLGTPDAANGGLAVLWFVIWVGSVVHSLLLNVFWLRWQEAHRPAAQVPWGAPPPGLTTDPFGRPVPVSAVPVSPVPVSSVPVSPPYWTTSGYGPLDVNAATAAQLTSLTGFEPARVAYLLNERARRGGFTSVEEFAAAAQLTPHQFALLRAQLTCAPRY